MAGPAVDPALYRSRDLVPVRRALISVSDKTDLLPLAQALDAAGVEIVSTGGSAALLRDAGLAVKDVAEITGFPESLGGRVKTLHPSVHAGLLADLRLEDHETQLDALGILPFELVVVNLYPFVETVASGAVGDAVVEQIDIGGPAMVRASAKNFANVAIAVSPRTRDHRGARRRGHLARPAPRARRARLRAHRRVRPRRRHLVRGGDPRGRGRPAPAPHDQGRAAEHAALRRELAPARRDLHAPAPRHRPGDAAAGQGDVYNNYVDADAALRAAFDMVKPAVAIIKHANPCGIAIAAPNALDPIASAHLRAHECDPVSAFGGVIAANRTVTLKMAENLRDIFTEVIVAPDFEPEALEVFASRRTCACCAFPTTGGRSRWTCACSPAGSCCRTPTASPMTSSRSRRTGSSSPASARQRGGDGEPHLRVEGVPRREVERDRARAGLATVGIGMGQVNRVDSCRLAVERAGDRAAGRSPHPTRSSPSPTVRRCSSTPASARSCSRAARCATRRSSTRRAPRASRCSSRRAALLPLTG
jgi:phosphoribosylaminoimidazolecarboxamide formyltransferase/IMP cyclohydrolase